LHNTGRVASLDLCEGDTVFVERRGEVIPQVTRVLLPKRPKNAKPWVPPKKCPACGSKLVLRNERMEKEGGKTAKPKEPAVVDVLMCDNSKCSARREQLLQQFVANCVKGIGKGMVKDFLAHELCSGPVDLYSLHLKRAQVPPGSSQVLE
jgi:DNA ligase (NAD+)